MLKSPNRMTTHQIQKAKSEKLVPRFSSAGVFAAAATYFALVFAIGFMLGPIRVQWGIPRVGERNAELIELPLMLIAVFLSARCTVYRFRVAAMRLSALGLGIIALGFLLIAEILAVLWLRGISISEYVQSRDRVSGAAYLLTLVMFALMPWLVARRVADRGGSESSAVTLTPLSTKGDRI